MSGTALAGLVDAAEALVTALDAGEVGAIEAANARLAAATLSARAPGAWHDTEAARAAAAQGARLAEAARVRVNYLADRNRQRLQAIALLRGGPGALGYDRTGRLRG